MEQNPSLESYSRSANQICCLLWNQKDHYYFLKSPPLVSVLSQMNLVHILTPYFFKIHFNIIVPSTSKSLNCGFFPLGFRLKFYTHFLLPSVPPISISWFDHPTNMVKTAAFVTTVKELYGRPTKYLCMYVCMLVTFWYHAQLGLQLWLDIWQDTE